ncbi:MAG: hypothetical protein GY754_30180 [bacterium]|nr:hypothetical protein [bacterium]
MLKLKIEEKLGIFAGIEEIEIPSSFIRELLEENVPLALGSNTEKARSEIIIAPILLEIRKFENKNISIFSGVDFTVDEKQELKGTCDFIISLSKEQLFLDAPVVTIVEAKKENILEGIPQCIAEMKAAQLFNERKNNSINTIFGIVTTGNNWKFLKLIGDTIHIDLDEYHIKETKKILGILHFMCSTN